MKILSSAHDAYWLTITLMILLDRPNFNCVNTGIKVK